MSKKNTSLKKIMCAILVSTMMVTSVAPVYAQTVDTQSTQQSVQAQQSDKAIPQGFTVFDKADFEPLAGGNPLEPLEGFNAVVGNIELSNEHAQSVENVQNMKINPNSPTDSGFDVKRTYENTVSNAKVSFDFYYDGVAKRNMAVKFTGGGRSDVHTRDVYIGINANGILCRAQGDNDSAPNIQKQFGFPEIGWHNFEVDYTVRGQVTYSMDGEELFVVENLKHQDEFPEFNTIAFVNYWEKGLGDQGAVYIDNFQILKQEATPQNVVADDDKNEVTFDFFTGFEDVKNYEYTVDGGATYTTCTSQTIYVGNVAVEANQIGIRVISSNQDVNKTVYVEKAFTVSPNQFLTFENEVDIENFTVRSDDKTAIHNEMSVSGLSCFGLTSETKKTNTDYQYEITQHMGTKVEGKILTMWYYDTMQEDVCAIVAPYNSTAGNGGKEGKIALGVTPYTASGAVDGEDYYYYRDFNKGSGAIQAAPRSIGWHEFKWDYTVDGKCTVYVDDIKMYTGDSDGFDKIHYIDWWSKHRHTSYYDDLQIVDSPDEIVKIAKAPTAPVTDDVNKTFGFTTVEGKDDVSLYEYSVDAGKTFKPVTSNPIALEQKGYDAGTVMVRLKATDEYAGAVLRSTVAFTEPDVAFKESLEKLYSFAQAFNKDDYTTASWTSANFEAEFEKTEASLESGTGYRDAEESLQIAVDKLVLDLDDKIVYDFEGALEEKSHPFNVVSGTVDWDPATNISSIGEQAFKVNQSNGLAEVKYTFAEPIKDKFVEFTFADTDSGQFHVKFIDSKSGDGIHFYGSGSKYYYQTIENGVYGTSVDTSMRRRADWYNLELNFALGDGVVGTMDTRSWLKNGSLSQFDTIELRTNSKDFTIDNFSIYEKNPITKITPNTDKVTLGYYDTFEMNMNNVEYETEKDYKTTDIITYTSSDKSVASVTTEGSIEPMGFGTATVTATATSGASAKIEVEAKDIKVSSIKISDSDYNDEPNYIDSLTIQPGYKQVVNAILAPKGVTERDVEWVSSDESVLTVVDGEISAHKEGTATVKATSKDGGLTAQIVVTVAPEKINYTHEFFIAKDGDDYTGTGTEEAPFATIQRARDEIRSLSALLGNGAVVYLKEGEYTILDGVEFDAQDSGINGVSIKYCAYGDDNVKLTGAVQVKTSEMSKVTDEEALKKLPASSRDKIYVMDLSSQVSGHKPLQYSGHSINYTPWLEEDGYNVANPYYSVTFDGAAQTLSRWPNEGQNVYSGSYLGYTKINNVLHAGVNPRNWKDDMIGKPNWVPEDQRDKTDSFELASDKLSERISTWYGLPTDKTNIIDEDIWMVGYWYNDFSDQSTQVRWINEYEDNKFSLKSEVPSGYSARSSMSYNRFYIYNVMQELDQEGEWYFDQKEYKLYYYPEASVNMNDDHTLRMSVLEETMFTFDETANITVSGLDIENVLGHAVEVLGSEKVKFENSTVRATELKVGIIDDSESGAMSFESGFENCNFYDVNGGIEITGGDLVNLIPQGNYVTNCHFKNFATVNKSYNPAIALEEGVGNRISSCMIEDGPHNAITYSGNDHVMEFIEITDVVKESKDQSAIYTGRNALQRGSVVRNCYIHDIPKGSGNPNSAIYLDDLTAGLEIIDNKFENMGWGLFINGGRDNFMIDNEFINCGSGVIMNDWGYMGVNNWYVHGYGTVTHPHTMAPAIEGWNDPTSPYGKYEHLWCIREDNPWHSKYNTFVGNTKTGTGSLLYYMSRGVQANATDVIDDWYFIKGNN